jgi:hypothetical protein
MSTYPIPPYSSEAEIEAVVKGFEDCTTPKDDFTHRLHLTVGVWYIWHSDTVALEKMRDGLLRFLGHHEVPLSKYQEALTITWLELIRRTMGECEERGSLIEVTNFVVNRLSYSSLVP